MLSLALLLTLSAPPTLTAEAITEGVQAYYQGAQDLKARFKQTYTYTIYDRDQVSEGIVYFKKPRRMRWDYQRPQPKVFVTAGEILWVYEPEHNQAFRQDLKAAQLPVALTFMSGEGSLKAAFDITLKGQDAESYTLTLIPKAHEGDYKSLELRVRAADFAVLESVVIDPVGNRNRIEFLGVETNAGLPDAGFQFTPPKGVQIIEDEGR
ncbi:outer membrane lipoprotein chaperone LolA [Myxococcota bacterium]|nr:outer membrane lipoprotein chaperone LolA [Myxococcota bacterium]MBU1432178.1 outer membrane lipoprotein chaperone LolA [Myxococcota bacterium]MBU1899207.1 outer membrane lipoprotein chaperone LolA [Myxococcota bacterium]